MDIKCVTGVYFGHSGAAKRIATALSSVICENVSGCDISKREIPPSTSFLPGSVAVFVIPAFGGRLRASAAKRVCALSGQDTAALAVVLCESGGYGDALLELYDLLTERGFCVIGAAAFVCDKKGRPDDGDFSKLVEFASACSGRLEEFCGNGVKLSLPGNRPYKAPDPPRASLKTFARRVLGTAGEEAPKKRQEPEWYL